MKGLVLCTALLLMAGLVHAGEITCKGSITSVQGEGLVARTHRFEVSGVTGNDIMALLEKCKKLAQQGQNQAARKNPGGNFRKFSNVELLCVQGGESFTVKRALQTAP
jgi:hypothetical protein